MQSPSVFSGRCVGWRHRYLTRNLSRTACISSSTASIPRPTAEEQPAPHRVDHRVPIQQQLSHSLRNLSHLLQHLRPTPQALITQIQDSLGHLDSPNPNPFRVSFYGSNRSRRSHVVDCLLLNTLETPPSPSTQLLSHRQDQLDQDGSLLIKFDQEPQQSPGCLKIRHPWLNEHSLEIQEMHTNWDPSSNPFLSQPAPSGDLIVVVLDALTEHHLLFGSPSCLPGPSIHQPSLVLLNSSHPQIYADLLPTLDHLPFTPPLIHFNSSAALTGLHTIAQHPSSLRLVNQSGLDHLRTSILSILKPSLNAVPGSTQTITPTALLKTLSLYQHALSTSTHLILRLSESSALASNRLYMYQLKFDQLAKQAHQVLFPTPASHPSPSQLSNIMDILRKEVPFWKLPFISDQVAYRVVRGVEDMELSQIEKNLIFQAGHLKMIKERSEELIQEIIQDPLLKDYQSEILVNQTLQDQGKLQRVELGGQGLNDQEVQLIQLFKRRRDQLISLGGPVSMIQSKADQFVITNLSAGVGVSIFTYFSYLGSSQPPMQFESFQFCFSNYQPISAFILVSLIWLSQSHWRRTSRRFALDYSRWRDSLNFDLSAQKQRIIDEILFQEGDGGEEKKGVKIIKQIQAQVEQSLKAPSSHFEPQDYQNQSTCNQVTHNNTKDRDNPSNQHLLPYHYNLPTDSTDEKCTHIPSSLVSLVNLFVKDLELIHQQIKKLFIQK